MGSTKKTPVAAANVLEKAHLFLEDMAEGASLLSVTAELAMRRVHTYLAKETEAYDKTHLLRPEDKVALSACGSHELTTDRQALEVELDRISREYSLAPHCGTDSEFQAAGEAASKTAAVLKEQQPVIEAKIAELSQTLQQFVQANEEAQQRRKGMADARNLLRACAPPMWTKTLELEVRGVRRNVTPQIAEAAGRVDQLQWIVSAKDHLEHRFAIRDWDAVNKRHLVSERRDHNGTHVEVDREKWAQVVREAEEALPPARAALAELRQQADDVARSHEDILDDYVHRVTSVPGWLEQLGAGSSGKVA